MPLIDAEWLAWQAVVKEFWALRLDMERGGNGHALHNAIVRWGEELAQLRMADPDPMHAAEALKRRRAEGGA